MKFCKTCGELYEDDSLEVCPEDDTPLKLIHEKSTDEDPMLGQMVDRRFRVVSMLGKGGFGAVYRAVQTSVGREVAIKFILEGMPPEGVRRFMREAKATSAALGPASVRLASTVKGPKSVCVPSPASWVVPSRTLPSSAICTLLASIRRRLKSSGALPPTATPPRTRMGVPARLASVALVTGAMRASRSAERRHGACGARASWMTAVPFNVPTLSRASRSARIGPARRAGSGAAEGSTRRCS